MKVVRWAMYAILGLLLLVGVAGCGGYFFLRGSTTPTLDGELALNGMKDSVTVERDPSGVPHIQAENDEDMYFALGVVHAQDRLWQMEFQRRVGAGRLSEVLGEATVEQDRFLRTVGFYPAAEQSYDALPDESRAAVDSYVEGINAYLETGSGLPLEFRLLGYEPERWQPADVLVWAKIMSLDLSANYESELTRYRLASSGIERERIEELIPPYPEDAIRILSESGSEPERNEAAAAQSSSLLANREALPESLEASNNWVVSGSRTESGEPLLADDPHLGLGVPSIWYLAHIQSPGVDEIGATLPGLPAVVIGRNDRIAWGVTNVGADVQDLYVLDETDDGGSYRAEGETVPYEVREETIEVADGEDVPLEVRQSEYGPVVSDVVDAGEDAPPLALRWTTLEPDDTTIDAFLEIGRAGNWDEFNEALRGYVAPSQNFVYADVDGNIGYVAPGRFPIRASGHTGLYPNSGGEDWRGYVPFEEWPRTLNPEEGYVVTANNRVTPEGYPYDLALEWAEPYRAQRIREMIEARRDLTVEDMTRMQQDQKSLLFKDFESVLREMDPTDSEASRWRDRLLEWDGVMDQDSPEATVFAAWYAELTTLPADETGEEFWNEPRYLLAAMEKGDRNCRPATANGCLEFARKSMERALSRFDGEPPEWGEVHRAAFVHPVLGETPLRRVSDREVAFGGDASTVNVGAFDFGSFEMSAGPSYRHVVDLGAMEGSVFIHPMGQSGNVLSRHFDDLLEDWRTGEYLPMRTEGYDVDKTLELRPK